MSQLLAVAQETLKADAALIIVPINQKFTKGSAIPRAPLFLATKV